MCVAHVGTCVCRYVAAAMVVGHVLATRGPTWWAGHAPADFSTIAFTMAGPLGPLYFLYYIVFPSAAAYHSLYGIGRGNPLLSLSLLSLFHFLSLSPACVPHPCT